MCPQVRSTRLGQKTSSFSRSRCLRQGLHCTQEGPQSLHVVCSPRAKQVSIFCITLCWGFYGKIETFRKRLGVNGQGKIETAIKKLNLYIVFLFHLVWAATRLDQATRSGREISPRPSSRPSWHEVGQHPRIQRRLSEGVRFRPGHPITHDGPDAAMYAWDVLRRKSSTYGTRATSIGTTMWSW